MSQERLAEIERLLKTAEDELSYVQRQRKFLLDQIASRKYRTGRKVTNEEIKRVNLKRNTFHGDWNYIIRPSTL